MTYKLYRCGSRLLGTEGKLIFVTKGNDPIDLTVKATILGDALLSWTIGQPLSYGYRGRYSYSPEPQFAISTHKETT